MLFMLPLFRTTTLGFMNEKLYFPSKGFREKKVIEKWKLLKTRMGTNCGAEYCAVNSIFILIVPKRSFLPWSEYRGEKAFVKRLNLLQLPHEFQLAMETPGNGNFPLFFNFSSSDIYFTPIKLPIVFKRRRETLFFLSTLVSFMTPFLYRKSVII